MRTASNYREELARSNSGPGPLFDRVNDQE